MDKLNEYTQKRDFRRSPEPRGKSPAAEAGHRFVVQKHAARRLHYDLRLELNGVLKSWAIPKGPSFDPAEKRLAVHVEDHPIEYADFEGVIPEHTYGAGTVMVWDQGTWEPVGDPRDGYRKGRLHFRLSGARLRGEWALARMHGAEAGENKENWLLLKIADAYARAGPDTDDARAVSVRSGRTLENIGREPEAAWIGQGRAALAKTTSPVAPPPFLEPQLATLVERPPSGPVWLHEIKLDGYRTLCRIDGPRITLYSRNGKDWTQRFGALARALRALPVRTGWLDGEVTVTGPDGRTGFSALQRALSEGRDDDLVYFLFDLLYQDGEDLRTLPLSERKQRLAALLAHLGTPASPLKLADHILGDGDIVFAEACRLGLEGLVSKRGDRRYAPGRGRDWLKVRCMQRQEFVIGGFSAPTGARTGLGALLLGVYEGERLVYVGRVGTGFNERTLLDLRARLDPLVIDRSPFANTIAKARSGKNVVSFVQPSLVAEVEFKEWTADGILRQAVFQGLREDKPPRTITRERPSPPAETEFVPAPLRERVAGQRLTHPGKVLYPNIGVTKSDLARYYESVAEHLLPDLTGRPLTLFRCPEGRHLPCFFQKHANHRLPAGLRNVPISEQGATENYIAVENLSGVVGLVQMGVLEIHTWGAHAEAPDRPDRMVLDLDPDEGLPWEAVTAAVEALHARIDTLGLASFLKTTGGKGLHVVIPLQRRHSWDDVKNFSHALARSVVRDAPRAYTVNPSKAARRGKVYIDYLRNTRGASAIQQYSTRAKPGATVAVPLRWDELGTRSDAFNVTNVAARLAKLSADPWEHYNDARAIITKVMKRNLGLG